MERSYTQINLSIDKKVWKEFRHIVINNEESASKKVEEFMREEIKKRKKPMCKNPPAIS